MSSRLRSSSVGAKVRPKTRTTSRAESAAAVALDVRCACQFFQSESLLPERVNPIGSRPPSSLGTYSFHGGDENQLHHPNPIHSNTTASPNHFTPIINLDQNRPHSGTDFSFGIVGQTDYYAESITSRPSSPSWIDDHEGFNEFKDPIAEVTPHNLTNQLNTLVNERETAEHPPLIKQKDLGSSVLLSRKRSASQHSTDRTFHQPRDPSASSVDRAIKQRDPSASSILRMRTNLSKNNLRDTSVNRDVHHLGEFTNSPVPGRELATTAPSSEQRVLRQRDPSQSSILRRKMLMNSQITTPTVEHDHGAASSMGVSFSPGSTSMYFTNQKDQYQSPSPVRDLFHREEPKNYQERGFQDSSHQDRRFQNLENQQNTTIRAPVERRSRLDDKLKQDTLAKKEQNPMALSLVPSRSSRYSRGSNENVASSEELQRRSLDQISIECEEEIVPVTVKPPKNSKKQPTKKAFETVDVMKNLQLPFQLVMPNMETQPVQTMVKEKIQEMMTVPMIITPIKISGTPVAKTANKSGDNSIVIDEVLLSECIQSKVFENYDFGSRNVPHFRADVPLSSSTERKSTDRIVDTPLDEAANVPIPIINKEMDGHEAPPSIMRQRDPSTSSFTRNRYNPPPPEPAVHQPFTDMSDSVMFSSEYPVRRASEISTIIKQKDLSSSTLLNRRRGNMSEARDCLNINDIYSPADKISKTVSFEFDKQLLSSPYEFKREGSPYEANREGSPYEIKWEGSPYSLAKPNPDMTESSTFKR